MQNENLTAVMQFHGKNIAFQEVEGKMMVNATQMAKPFSKRTRDWLVTQQAKDLLTAMTETRNLASDDLQVVKRGGSNQGTWFHEDVALLFAQWLSPEFYLACNTKLKELVTTQALSLPTKHQVAPIVHEGKLYYPYMAVMHALGGSTRSSASKRKRKNPEHFIKVFGRNFITGHYFDLLKGYYDYKKLSNQLSLAL
ncbi:MULTISPECIES: KilA-N domain-containing protein [Bizionia]|uniref:KilA-N domain-containing protein n=1 Tax=Bizionia algoritergicola TaxID=291187 RepID=A0A5D0R128_9FLAO|nr:MULTISPECIES: KilA-N domain-containing protein [Bizionia]TYB74571.1 KilA-N domain-containing protein [Bizionia algoritergicola]